MVLWDLLDIFKSNFPNPENLSALYLSATRAPPRVTLEALGRPSLQRGYNEDEKGTEGRSRE